MSKDLFVRSIPRQSNRSDVILWNALITHCVTWCNFFQGYECHVQSLPSLHFCFNCKCNLNTAMLPFILNENINNFLWHFEFKLAKIKNAISPLFISKAFSKRVFNLKLRCGGSWIGTEKRNLYSLQVPGNEKRSVEKIENIFAQFSRVPFRT